MHNLKPFCLRIKYVFQIAERRIVYRKLGYCTPSLLGNRRLPKCYQLKAYSGVNTHQDHLSKLNATASYTMQSRILKYMRSNSKYNTAVRDSQSTSTLVYDSQFLKSKLNDNKRQESLSELILNVTFCSTNLPSRDFLSLISQIDHRCCLELNDMSRSDILKTLDAWMYILPHRLISLKFFSSVLKKMKLWLTSDKVDLTTEDFLQMLFYVGLLKKSPQLGEIMSLCLHYIDNYLNIQSISVLELCLLANAIFKTSTKISSNKILISISFTLENQLDAMLSDPALLVTLVKPLRHAEFYEPKLLELIEQKMIANPSIVDTLNFVAKVHLLALYAGAKYSKIEIINLLLKSSCLDLNKSLYVSSTNGISSYLSERPRNKDLSRFLWSISSLNVDLDKSTAEEIIIPLLNDRLQCGNFDKEPEEIIDCLLSLWILGHYPYDLVLKSLTPHNLVSLRMKNVRRYNSRLALLLTCIEMESPIVFNKINTKSLQDTILPHTVPSVEKHLKNRPLLKKVYMGVTILAQNYGFSKVTCNFIIPHLHIAGLTVATPSGPLHIEVLDDSVYLQNSEKLQGLAQLKLRLLKTSNNTLISINSRDIYMLTEMTDLQSFLEKELQKVARIFWK